MLTFLERTSKEEKVNVIMEKIQILSTVMFKRSKKRTLKTLASISKSENSAKSSVAIASSTETSSAKENGKKLDMILKGI